MVRLGTVEAPKANTEGADDVDIPDETVFPSDLNVEAFCVWLLTKVDPSVEAVALLLNIGSDPDPSPTSMPVVLMAVDGNVDEFAPLEPKTNTGDPCSFCASGLSSSGVGIVGVGGGWD